MSAPRLELVRGSAQRPHRPGDPRQPIADAQLLDSIAMQRRSLGDVETAQRLEAIARRLAPRRPLR